MELLVVVIVALCVWTISDDDETRIPAHIAYRRELNEAEQENIARGQDWALGRRRDVLNETFITDLHGHMLGDGWRWAVQFRAGGVGLRMSVTSTTRGR